MAAKKTKSKSVPQKGKAKPLLKPSKAPPAAKKKLPAKATPQTKPTPVAKKKLVVKEAAPKKKLASDVKKKPVVAAKVPSKKAATDAKKKPAAKESPKKPEPKPKASPKKDTAERPGKKTSPTVDSAKKVSKPDAAAPVAMVATPVKVEPPAKLPAPAKKTPAVKPRSSVVDFPAPPAPVRPPFIPPKAVVAPADGPVAPGSNGTHSATFVQKQRQRLLDLRDDLVDAVSGMARDTIRNAPEGSEASGSGQHQGDAGSDAYDRDFALSVLAKEQDALYEIEQALYRIKQGSYGICEISARKIPQARLEAIPFARLTVECQAQWEKEYGNRRFRPSNEVGFSGGNYAEDEDSESVSLDEDDD